MRKAKIEQKFKAILHYSKNISHPRFRDANRPLLQPMPPPSFHSRPNSSSGMVAMFDSVPRSATPQGSLSLHSAPLPLPAHHRLTPNFVFPTASSTPMRSQPQHSYAEFSRHASLQLHETDIFWAFLYQNLPKLWMKKSFIINRTPIYSC